MRPRILFLGEVEYLDSFESMQAFTSARDTHSADEFWILSHSPVYTQGTSCDAQPLYGRMSIPVVKSDRGGQITYHGPGQLIIYLLLDIKRLGIGPKRLVSSIEAAIINLLASYDIRAKTRQGAPGVYVSGSKIAALGLRVRRGACYHGLSLNVDMDLTPFDRIDPCGYQGLEVTDMSSLGVNVEPEKIVNQLVGGLIDEIYSSTTGD